MVGDLLTSLLHNMACGEDSQIATIPFKFGDLPSEIRIKIWKLSMLPRFVTIRIQEAAHLTVNDRPILEYSSTNPVPSILQVCHESRAEALRTYRLCFGTEAHHRDNKKLWQHVLDDGIKFTFKNQPKIYFSYELDTANFVWQQHYIVTDLPIPFKYLALAQTDFDNIQRIGSGGLENSGDSEQYLCDHITYIKSLQEIILPMEISNDEKGSLEELEVEVIAPTEGSPIPDTLSLTCPLMYRLVKFMREKF